MLLQDKTAQGRYVLPRPRVDALIQQGLSYPLLVLLAPTGFGKTQSMLHYTTAQRQKAVWVHCSASDNLPDRFWLRLMRTLGQHYPALAQALQALPFPSSMYGLCAFLELLEQAIAAQGSVIWIFDDYGNITNQQIKDFVSLLVDARLEQLHLVLLSNEPSCMESIAFMVEKSALIMTNQLRFTRNEIKEFFCRQNMRLTEAQLSMVLQYTEGWPLPLSMLASQYTMPDKSLWCNQRATVNLLQNLFEEQFFDNYPEALKQLLRKLSLVETFQQSLVLDAAQGDVQLYKSLLNHPFLVQAPQFDQLYFHRLYRDFLQVKAKALTPKAQHCFWLQVATAQLQNGEVLNAVASFEKAGETLKMLQAMYQTLTCQATQDDKTDALFLQQLDQLPEALRNQYPIADAIQAKILMRAYRLPEAHAVLQQMEARLLAQTNLQNREMLLAELYLQYGLLRMLQVQDDFGLYFQKALPYAPAKAYAQARAGLQLNNGFVFYMAGNGHGARQRVETAMLRDLPGFIQRSGGWLAGMPQLFLAETAYLTMQLDTAQQQAYHCVYAARASKQHDVACNGYIMLARIGWMQGNAQEIAQSIESLVAYEKENESIQLAEIRDTALAWYYTKMHDCKHIAKSLRAIEGSKRLVKASHRLFIIYASYLANAGEFAKLVGLLQQLSCLPQLQPITQESIYLRVLLALGYHCLGNAAPAVQQLWIAYDACWRNQLIAPFIEAEGGMLALLESAQQQSTYAFDAAWIAQVQTECRAFIKRANAARAAYRRQQPQRVVKNNPLSKRELAVLQAIARGLTREEIAQEQFISMNTVKSTISSIFNKLNAKNKADAVSIALAKGYIEGHTAESQ